MPKKTVKMGRHEYRYADSLHKKIVADAKRAGITNSDLLTMVFKEFFLLHPLKPMPKPPKRPRR